MTLVKSMRENTRERLLAMLFTSSPEWVSVCYDWLSTMKEAERGRFVRATNKMAAERVAKTQEGKKKEKGEEEEKKFRSKSREERKKNPGKGSDYPPSLIPCSLLAQVRAC
jgi:hypothetical protein